MNRNTILGIGLFGVAAAAAYSLINGSSAQAASGDVVSFTPADTNTVTPVKIGNILQFVLPLTAAGQTWQAVLNDPSGVVAPNPTTVSTAAQETDSYNVVAKGTATIGYQLFDVNNAAVGAPLTFQVQAA